MHLLPRAFAAENRQTCRLRFCTLRRMHLLAHAFAAEKRQMCRLRFCVLRQIFFITARDCGREAANVPFAVLRVTANALTVRGCGREAGNVPVAGFARCKRTVCGFACYGKCIYYRARLRQKRQTCRLRFCALRQIFFITVRVCGKDAEIVPFAVLHFKANALTAYVCGKSTVIGIIQLYTLTLSRI